MTTTAEPNKEALSSYLKRRLFSTWYDTVFTIVLGACTIWIVVNLLDWSIINAVWTVENRDQCGHGSGACWAVLQARGKLILFGLYPHEEYWRSTLACIAIITTIVLSCIPWFWNLRRLPMLWLCGFAIFFVLMRGGLFGLSIVTTEQWGGLSLTIFIFCGVVLTGMPMAIGLALARRSKLPVVSFMAGFLIDVVRSLPLLAILFAAAVVVPLVVPDWAQGNKLTRVILAFGVFFACYQAEILRAGIQSLPSGQEEAAAALGMPRWSQVVDIVLPQAFRSTLPSTINQFVVTFKETSIVTIIGFFEVMASGNAALGTGEWSAQFVEVYVFLALIYFTFVFGLSRYGAWLENRMRLNNG